MFLTNVNSFGHTGDEHQGEKLSVGIYYEMKFNVVGFLCRAECPRNDGD